MIALIVIVIAVAAAAVLAGVGRTVRIVPQARAYVIERLGSYSRTLDAGLNTVVPFIDRVRARIDLREQVVSFAPQPVITEDNLVVHIDTVLYFQVTDPTAATYEIADFIQAIEQLTVTTLRNVIGGLDLERTLTSREQINAELRGVLDEATGKWGIRVNRVELKAIDPPGSIKDAMEKQLRADRDKRAAPGRRRRPPGPDPHRRRRQARRDPHRRGRQAGRDPHRRGGTAGPDTPRPGAGPGHRHRIRSDPPGTPGPRAARLPVPADTAQDSQRRRQPHLAHPQRADQGTRHARVRVR
jgi:regulator of protease activity HflC (stomatin/prohibitin superfamily)